jgi:preprotein translocase subunit SecG
MDVAFQIATIIISIALVVLILLQSKGADMLGDIGSSLSRTRRGLEKTLFQFTVGLSTAFLLICILAVVFSQNA